MLCTAPAVISREGNIVADPCSASQLGVGYGVWARTGSREFAITFIGNICDSSTGEIVGRYKVRSQGTLQADLDTFTGIFRTDTFDLSGNLLATVTGTVLGKRIKVEPLT